MDRKEKIYEELKSYSRSGEAEGLDAQQLAELTGLTVQTGYGILTLRLDKTN